MIYALEAAIRGLFGEVLVNGVSVFRHTGRTSRSKATKINGWVVTGTNTVEVRLSAPWTTPTPPQGDASPMFQTRLIGAPHGAIPDSGATLVDFTWSAEESPLPPLVPTEVMSADFTANGYGPWAWEGAVNAPLGDADRAEAIEFLGEIAAALRLRDAFVVAGFFQLKHEELARALDVPFEDLEAGHRSLLQRWFADPAWTMEPPNGAAVVLREGAGGRVFEALGPTGGPALEGRTGASAGTVGAIPIPLFLARVGDAWTVVR